MAANRDWKNLAVSASKASVDEPRQDHDTVAVENVIVPLGAGQAASPELSVGRLLVTLYGAVLHLARLGAASAATLHGRELLQELGFDPGEGRAMVVDDLPGEPAEAILQAARELPASLIVMAGHAVGEPGTAGLGTLAEAVLNAAPKRLVLVPDCVQPDWHPRRIVLVHDGMRDSDSAIGPAADLAHRSGAEVLALHVGARGAPEPGLGNLPAPRYIDQPQHEWPWWTNEFLDRMVALGASPRHVTFKLLVTGGQPGSEIAQFVAENAVDLLVASWRGRWERKRSETLKVVLRRCGCPIYLIHAGGD